jgi:hypothetical protein
VILRRGIANSRSIVFTHDQAVGLLGMLEAFLDLAHEKAVTPEMPCTDLQCGYSLCEFMRLLQKERDET